MAARKRRANPHPEQEHTALLATLEDGLPPAVLLRGEERHFRTQGMGAVCAAAAARGDEVCRHDARDPEFSPSALVDDLRSGALFASARTIALENGDALLKKGARGFSQAILDGLLARLEAGVPGTLAVGAGSLRADHPLLKAVLAAGGVTVACRKLYDSPPPWDPDPRRAELVQWLLAKARERGVPLDPDEAVWVAAAVGNDPAALCDRLEELRGRGAAGVRELVGWEAGGSPWDLAGRLVAGDAQGAVAGVETLFQGGFQGRDGTRTVDPAALVNVLASALTARVREGLAGSAALGSGASPEEAAAAAGVRGGPRAVEAFLARLARRAPGDWRRMLEESAALERHARSGARVDGNDFALLALRWALKGKSTARNRN